MSTNDTMAPDEVVSDGMITVRRINLLFLDTPRGEPDRAAIEIVSTTGTVLHAICSLDSLEPFGNKTVQFARHWKRRRLTA